MAVATGNHWCTFHGLLNLMPMRNTTKSPSISAVKRPGCTLTVRSLRCPAGSSHDRNLVGASSFLGSAYRERITVVGPASVGADDRPRTAGGLRRGGRGRARRLPPRL